MSERISKVQRWLDLIAYLVGRRLPVTAEEILEQITAYARKWRTRDETARASVRRMFERDKDELRKAGIPLQTVPYSIHFGLEQVEGYQITKRDFYLPYLRLVRESIAGAAPAPGRRGSGAAPGTRRDTTHGSTERARVAEAEIGVEDAALALEALRRVADVPSFPFTKEAKSAFRKLAFDLDPSAFRDAPVLFVERPGEAEISDHLRRVSDALLARKRLRFRYQGIYRGEATERTVYPYGLLFQHGHWYLFAHDTDRNAVRVFRVDRMADVTPNRNSPGTADYEIPADFRLDDYVNRQPWELGDEPPIVASVQFAFPRSLWAERNGYGTLEEELPGGAAIRRFEVHQVNPFLRWLLSMENDVILRHPPELSAELRSLARQTAALYGKGDFDA